ncbi:hypothetical protein [Conchiformibius kuhniae]|uniref:Uncharacterized protein n=1 Tax=Conchiformibius kuhniae TaxID=211502 RepID=A0A8T9MRX5_9NEIS|nr:hypothetical protein [Conchiformibius kuhniae]UOP04650.1 hypothetical protein LVJ77_10640 [Conchiformibius kuhniae]
MSNNLPNSNNDGYGKSSGGGSSGGNPPSPSEPIHREIQEKVDKILDK